PGVGRRVRVFTRKKSPTPRPRKPWGFLLECTLTLENAFTAEIKTMSAPRHIRIFDTTLRDGEQSPGASMNIQEKMEIAQALVDLGVDIIEAGFPIASPGDFEAVKQIATNIRGSTICGLARCNEMDIDRAWEALKHAADARIHVFLATSAIHREFTQN